MARLRTWARKAPEKPATPEAPPAPPPAPPGDKGPDIGNLAAQVAERLSKVQPHKVKAEAKAIIEEFAERRLKSLPAGTKLTLLSRMLARDWRSGWWIFTADRDARNKVYAALELAPELAALEAPLQAQLVQELKGNALFKEAQRKWVQMELHRRLEVLQMIADTHSRVFGYEPARVVCMAPSWPPVYPALNGKDATGQMPAKGDREIHIEAQQWGTYNNFAAIFKAVIKENTHNHQRQLVERARNGQIAETDPLYTQAMLFELNFTSAGLVRPSESRDAYLAQPVVAHAERQKELICDQIIPPYRVTPGRGPKPEAGT